MKKILGSIGIATCLISLLPLLTAQAQPAKVKSFAEWCQQKDTVPAATKHTINVLLKEAATQDCQIADSKLKSITELILKDNQLIDLKPIAGLTNSIYLNLQDNQVIDIKPLAELSNLNTLVLYGNGISDIKPLARLTGLIQLAAKSTPSHSTFRRILIAVEPSGLAAVFNIWALGTMPLLLNRLLSIDGKSIKCTSSGGNTSSQNFTSLVSVYDDESAGVVQIQIMENKKQSEIGVAQNLISELASLPSGQIFSLDALHTQTATVAAIASAGHHCLIAVKQNQPTLYRTIESTAQTQTAISHASVFDASHGRTVEHWAGDPTSRSVSVFAAPVELLTKWIGIKSVIMVHRTGTRAQKPFTETVYYLSDQCLSADTYMTLIRGHWSIENRLHWVKDATFSEDYPPRLGGHAPVNWAIFFTWIVTLVRRAGIRTVPQALRLWANQVDTAFSFLV